jgi:hypothetical protein
MSTLDVYSRVGSNTPLILANVKAKVKDKGLVISFRGIVGSPIICGICVRKSNSQGNVYIQLTKILAVLHSTKPAHCAYMAIDLVDHDATINMDKQVLAEDISQSPIQSTDSHKEKEHPQLHIQSSDSKIKKVCDHITCSLSFLMWIICKDSLFLWSRKGEHGDI